jgi:acetyltransferase-like isoleucine patch superfamily enzyme
MVGTRPLATDAMPITIWHFRCVSVTIGDDVMMGCNVSLMTPIHPLLLKKENSMSMRMENFPTENT